MKRLLTSGLILLAMAGASSSFAQNKRVYDDDIYYNNKTAVEETTEEETVRERSYQRTTDNQDRTTSGGNIYSSGDENSRYEDDYVNYDDEYSYATQISRFNYPFYNRPYWSSFYNPYWYDPFWVDPYWGWNPWVRPGISVSFGMGPYWSSYWGWQSWYGFGGFNSYYGYPSFGMYGGYYSGFWNGYYAGLYNGYGVGRYRTVTYGPRYSMNATRNNFAHNVGYHGFRRETRNSNTQSAPPNELSAPRTNNGMRTLGSSTDRPVRDRNANMESTGAIREGRSNRVETIDGGSAPIRSSDGAVIRDRNFGDVQTIDNGRPRAVEQASPRGRWNNENGAVRNEQMATPAPQPRRERSSWFGNGGNDGPVRSSGQPPVQQQRTFSQPRMERPAPAPRMEAPSRNFGSGGSRGGFGGGNGGAIRGGRR